MTNDLIGRKEAIDLIRSLTVYLNGRSIFHPEAKNSVISNLESLPVINAAPVVHGRWLNKGYITTAYGSIDTGDCSVCGAVDVPIEPYDDYCPHCGAKMDKED